MKGPEQLRVEGPGFRRWRDAQLLGDEGAAALVDLEGLGGVAGA